jgi:hypothetical protein
MMSVRAEISGTRLAFQNRLRTSTDSGANQNLTL